MRWCYLVLLLVLSQWTTDVSCSGMFELRLDNFVNEFGRDADGTCCRGVRSQSGMCSGTCRTRFRVCLKHYQTTIDPNPPCTYGEVLTPVLGNNSVSLEPINDVATGFTNPIVFAFDFSWVGTFSLIVEAWHESEPTSTPGSSRKLITRLATQRWLDVSEFWTQDIHKTNHTAFSYAIRVRCLDNYYGDNCEKLCRPRNDKFGHYTCSPTGDKVCYRGWTGEYCTVAVCLPGCHEEHGYCEEPNECRCRLGWQGSHCNQCIRYPGCLHGTCNQPWQCNCDEGWGGLFCNQDLNYCTNHKPCKHGGTCTNTGQGSYTCTCIDGYSGKNCEKQADDCVNQPCLNGATCKSLGKNYTCECPLGFFGQHCETAASTCTENPCQNGGTCVDGPSGYLCVCPPAFEGLRCDTQKDQCEPTPCKNGGSCLRKDDSYNCVCPTGFTGDNCETDIDDCLINPCLNGGSCIDDINSFRCGCVPGFIGSLCQTNVDDCLTKPCSNGGTCHDLINDYRCDCAPGFGGKDCSINVDECQSEPCLNGGKCEDLVNEYLCHCTPGFRGRQCEKRDGILDSILPIPKGNGVTISSKNDAKEVRQTFAKNYQRDELLNSNGNLAGDSNDMLINPTALLEIAHQVSDEESISDSRNYAKTNQVPLIVSICSVALLLLVFIPIAYKCRQHSRQKREQREIDAEACRQNEQNNIMNNKCLDNQIINTLGLSGHKTLKMTNEGQDSSFFQKSGEDPLQRTTKLLNNECTCSSSTSTRSSKVLDTDLEHECAPRTLDKSSSNIASSKR
ncbi:delta-like protein 1 precursor [Parasteatoda tepidariorum]|uniref:Delta-like protein n=1 Tax=Parasteatoda tepidariorum TaxID=114398 RepID=A0ZVQ7_PARTP|nr:delta-like protein 1 precursor [Parasteatoda tepidariorum]BAF42029.1 Delta [Parasteatoda tepidariorum]